MEFKVSVILSDANLTNLKEYFCMGCGRKFFMSNRELLSVWLGSEYPSKEIPKGMGWVQVKCRGCTTVYNLYYQ